jgi:flagellar basal body-associated protein FliL
MDVQLIVIAVVAVVAIAAAYFLFAKSRDDNKKESENSGSGGPSNPTPDVKPATTELMPETRAPSKAKVVKPTLLSDSKLQAMTKTMLMKYALDDFGVTLSKSKTKADMIEELKKAVK